MASLLCTIFILPLKREALLNKLVKLQETPVKREETPEKGEEPKYAQGLKRRSMKKIIKYGIAFYEKECMVVMGDLKVKDTTPIPRWL